MFITSSEAKKIGKENMEFQWGASILAIVLFAILLSCGNIVPVIGSLAVLGPLNYGLTYIYYHASLKEKINYWDLFKGFETEFGENFLAGVLLNLFTMLWSMLFIVPGIIKSYSYSMTWYLLMREPELNAQQAIAKSIKMMRGHKGRLFLLDLSFIGWTILETMTFGLLGVYVEPYKRYSRMAFFNDLYEKFAEPAQGTFNTASDNAGNANTASENTANPFDIDPSFVVDSDVASNDSDKKPEE